MWVWPALRPEGTHDHTPITVISNILEEQVRRALTQPSSGVKFKPGWWKWLTWSFCRAKCTELTSFLPMKTQSKGVLQSQTCTVQHCLKHALKCHPMAKQFIKFWWIRASNLTHFLLHCVSGLDSDSDTSSRAHYIPRCRLLRCKQLLSQHAGKHIGHASTGHTTSLCKCNSPWLYGLATEKA